MTDQYAKFINLVKKVKFGGSSFFDKELLQLFDIKVEKNLPLVEREEGKFRFITSQPLDNVTNSRYYTTWEADVTDLQYTTVTMVGRYRFMNEQDAIDLVNHP